MAAQPLLRKAWNKTIVSGKNLIGDLAKNGVVFSQLFSDKPLQAELSNQFEHSEFHLVEPRVLRRLAGLKDHEGGIVGVANTPPPIEGFTGDPRLIYKKRHNTICMLKTRLFLIPLAKKTQTQTRALPKKRKNSRFRRHRDV